MMKPWVIPLESLRPEKADPKAGSWVSMTENNLKNE
jgi:hypothetical protein